MADTDLSQVTTFKPTRSSLYSHQSPAEATHAKTGNASKTFMSNQVARSWFFYSQAPLIAAELQSFLPESAAGDGTVSQDCLAPGGSLATLPISKTVNNSTLKYESRRDVQEGTIAVNYWYYPSRISSLHLQQVMRVNKRRNSATVNIIFLPPPPPPKRNKVTSGPSNVYCSGSVC